MLIKRPSDIRPSEITPESVYLNRRQFMQGAAALAATPMIAKAAPLHVHDQPNNSPTWLQQQVAGAAPASPVNEELTPFEDASSYNNFYEFGFSKTDPKKHGQSFNPHPWSVNITGLVNKPAKYTLEDILKQVDLEERIYRLRCVEAWSMVIPWVGFSLASLLKRVEPLSSAKYVAFTTIIDRKTMPGQRSSFSSISWPYVEGLRLDEAMNPLTLMAVGMYGKPLPNQNGAPLRLVVPWKYGFKSIKSIVKIELTDKQPPTTWNMSQPEEYGFYANVNPDVSHPRWSQARERRLPSGLFSPRIIATKMFNGYADQVAHLYKGMDLTKWY